jgi:hypothetical protein
MSERTVCPLQAANFEYQFGVAKWVPRGRDIVCSYCGSLHDEQFLKHVREVIENPDPDIRIELNDSRQKIYIARPEIKNAADGAIKYYLLHLKQWCATNDKNVDEMDKFLHEAFIASKEKFSVVAALMVERMKNDI